MYKKLKLNTLIHAKIHSNNDSSSILALLDAVYGFMKADSEEK